MRQGAFGPESSETESGPTLSQAEIRTQAQLTDDLEGAPDRGLGQTLLSFAAGRYSIVRLLGSGGQKIVYLVHDALLERECALALVRHASADADDDRLRAEARAMALLGSHPHIVTLFDLGEHEGRSFAVTEYVAGGNLRAALRETGGRLPQARVLDIGRQLLRALAFVHARGIVHRDLKPDNVWLTAAGEVKLGDFGIAQRGVSEEPRLVTGTPAYMAPEQIRGEQVDGRCDLYALGCTLYELLTGTPPFGRATSTAITGHASGAVPSLRTTLPEVGALDDFIRALMAKIPDERPASAVDALRRLDDLDGRVAPTTPHRDFDPSAVYAALQRQDVRGAARILQAQISAAPDPELRLQLGWLQFALRDADGARREFETALQEFTDRGLPRRAAIAAARLSAYYVNFHNNLVVARSWFAKAWSLVKDEGPCVERGWVLLSDVGCHVEDPSELLSRTEIALEMAHRFGDRELEAKAHADAGLALAEAGRVIEGMGRLDEALAIVTSNRVPDLGVTAQICCSLFSACQATGDLQRCESWGGVLRDRGLLGEKGLPLLNTHCGAVYGGLLCELGRWSEAEAAIQRAIESASLSTYRRQLHARAALAELRIRQQRLDEAEALLETNDDSVEAAIPLSRLHLARGRLDLAASIARRALRRLGGDRTRSVVLLSLVAEVELHRGGIERASAACAALEAKLDEAKLPALALETAAVRARVRAALGERDAAIDALETALANPATGEHPLLKARLHLTLAGLLHKSRREDAILEGKAAAAIFARLEVIMPADESALLDALGLSTAPPLHPSPRLTGPQA